MALRTNTCRETVLRAFPNDARGNGVIDCTRAAPGAVAGYDRGSAQSRDRCVSAPDGRLALRAARAGWRRAVSERRPRGERAVAEEYHANGDRVVRPVPDPTTLTTEQLRRELSSQKELFEAHLAAINTATKLLQNDAAAGKLELDEKFKNVKSLFEEKLAGLSKLNDEKFQGIQTQFTEREVRTNADQNALKEMIQVGLLSAKEAVATALQAAKEAVATAFQAAKEGVAQQDLPTTKRSRRARRDSRMTSRIQGSDAVR